jgi:dihydroorotase
VVIQSFEGLIVVVDTVLCNTKVYFDGELVEAGIAINDGKIVKIAKESNLPEASTTINLKGNITLPGLIDIHVHLRDQNLAYKETFKTGTAAAAAGGITTVIDMPNNSPVTMDSSTLKQRRKIAEKQVYINVGFNSAFPTDLKEMPELVTAGAVGFKVYLANGVGGINVDDDHSLLESFKLASEYKIPILIHAEDRKMIQSRKKEYERIGKSDLMSYVEAHSPEVERKSIQRIISLVKNFEIPVHFCHLSSKLGLDEILSAKKKGLPITCEVTPHNLFLSSEKYASSGSLALTDPPLRSENEAKILWAAVKRGFIDAIASDHAPHTLNEKTADSIWDVSPGVPGLETTLSLLLNQINKGQMSLAELVQTTSERPAKIFNLSNRGSIVKNNWADLVIIDLKQETTVDASMFNSKAKYSPFDGLRLKGKAVKTFVNGVLVMNENQIMSNSKPGQLIHNRAVV